MKINLLYEGGCGDFMCANRFVPAILEKYPDAEIKLFANTDGNESSPELLLKLFPEFYSRGYELVYRKSDGYLINTKFGAENLPAIIQNLTDESLESFNNCDKSFNFWIDGLQYFDYDLPINKYFYSFPAPETPRLELPPELPEKFILVQFYARPGAHSNLEQWYSNRLIKELIKSDNIVITCRPEDINFYSEFLENPRVKFATGDLLEICYIASKCDGFIGIDSGIRFFPISYGKPWLVFSGMCQQYGQVQYSHLIRWLIFKENILPMHFDANTVSKMINSMIEQPICSLYPFIDKNSVDMTVVNRRL